MMLPLLVSKHLLSISSNTSFVQHFLHTTVRQAPAATLSLSVLSSTSIVTNAHQRAEPVLDPGLATHDAALHTNSVSTAQPVQD